MREAVPAPLAAPDRLIALDAVRGLAVLGILVMNVVEFGLPIRAYANPAGGGGGVKFEEVGTISYVTWDGVFDFGSTTPNTFQYQFDRSNGIVLFAWQTMSASGNQRLSVSISCGSRVK